MQTMNSRFPLAGCGLASFEFAGFTWPRFVATLPTGRMAKRLERYKNHVTGPYYHAPKPGADGRGFYLNSDGMPGLRWQWCDDVTSSIRHTGWLTDEFGDSETIRGVVFRLPSGRGFLAGWSMGEGMASSLEYAVYDDESAAAHVADSLAENAAEKEREYQAAERARFEEEAA